jgi:hypothetical protein
MTTALLDARALGAQQRRRQQFVGLGLLVLTVLGGLLGATLVAGGHIGLLFMLAAVFLPVVIWRHPQTGPVFLVAAATLIEQYVDVPAAGAITGRIPLFVSFQAQFHLTGVFINPMELVLALILVTWIVRFGVTRQLSLPRSGTARLMLGLIVLVALEEAWGLSRGGNYTWSLWEIRPWIYLAAAYLVAAVLVRDQRTRSAVLWAFAIGVGLKGLQGVQNAIAARNIYPRPEAILSHEEAFFFGLFVVLTAILWLFGEKGRLRMWCTVLLPFVLYADLANYRRATWLIIGGGLLVSLLLAYVRLPKQRSRLTAIAAVTLLAGGGYLSAFWNNNGTFGQPARAIRSAVAPDSRDSSSNLYRVLEDENLQLNILDSFPFGKGFGIPINYKIKLIDLSGFDPVIKYVPHDDVLWVWMRLGVIGFLGFWVLIASAVIRACRLVRFGDHPTALFATFVIAALMGYLMEGNYDYGFYWFRVALLMGVLIGSLEGMAMAPVLLRSVPRPWRGDRAGALRAAEILPPAASGGRSGY